MQDSVWSEGLVVPSGPLLSLTFLWSSSIQLTCSSPSGDVEPVDSAVLPVLPGLPGSSVPH